MSTKERIDRIREIVAYRSMLSPYSISNDSYLAPIPGGPYQRKAPNPTTVSKPAGGGMKECTCNCHKKNIKVEERPLPSIFQRSEDGFIKVSSDKPKKRKQRSDKGQKKTKSEWIKLIEATRVVFPELSYKEAMTVAKNYKDKGYTSKDMLA